VFVYRICKTRYTALDEEGSRLYGGRWNSQGRPAVYTSTHLALAALELLVHLDFDNLPVDLVWLKIEIADASSFETFPNSIAPNERDAAAFGDEWLTAKRSLCLHVPSAVLSVEQNVILNPLHAEFAKVQTVGTNDFVFDDRLFKR
jgi:RES domain-containing protein